MWLPGGLLRPTDDRLQHTHTARRMNNTRTDTRRQVSNGLYTWRIKTGHHQQHQQPSHKHEKAKRKKTDESFLRFFPSVKETRHNLHLEDKNDPQHHHQEPSLVQVHTKSSYHQVFQLFCSSSSATICQDVSGTKLTVTFSELVSYLSFSLID